MDDRTKIDELRSRLLEMDQEILRLIERRARVSQDFAKLRPKTSRFMPVADSRHMLALETSVTAPFPQSAVRPVFSAIDNACRLYEVTPRVVFVGPEGDWGWIAAQSYFSTHAELVRTDSTANAIDEVTRSRADFAVIAYESLQDGPIFPTIQSIAGADLKLVGERQMVQSLTLISTTGEISDIEKVYCSAQDHVSCVNYLESHHPRALILDVKSPFAAWELASADAKSAAIVPRGFHGTNETARIVRENIGDDGETRLRYGIVSRLPAPRSGIDATAILFSVPDRPGALHEVLQHFKEKNCNLRRIQSRPIQGEGWDYLFYVEVGGHVTDRSLVSALEGVKRCTKMLKIIGSFPLEFADSVPPSQ